MKTCFKDFLFFTLAVSKVISTSYAEPKQPNIYVSNILISANNNSFNNIGYDNTNMGTNGELNIIHNVIRSDFVVFDVGANKGEWSLNVLNSFAGTELYSFEPIPKVFYQLKNNLTKYIKTRCYNVALSNKAEIKNFFYYDSANYSELSGLYNRPILFEKLNTRPTTIKVQCFTLDEFCQTNNISHIDFLKIDTEGAEADVLSGAQSLLNSGSISIIQFEYGGTYLDSKKTLYQIYTLLRENNYSVYRILPDSLLEIASWNSNLENYRYSNYLAIRAKL